MTATGHQRNVVAVNVPRRPDRAGDVVAPDQQFADQDAQRGVAAHFAAVGKHRARHLGAHMFDGVERYVEIGAQLMHAGGDAARARVDSPGSWVGISAGHPTRTRRRWPARAATTGCGLPD